MRVTFGKEASAVYIYLENTSQPVNKTYSCNPAEVNGEINLDFDKSVRLIRIEILDASRKPPPELLNQAEPIG